MGHPGGRARVARLCAGAQIGGGRTRRGGGRERAGQGEAYMDLIRLVDLIDGWVDRWCNNVRLNGVY